MKTFKHINAATLDEAVAALRKSKTQVLAGGIDLIGVLKDEVLPDYPNTLVNLKTIPSLDYIRESDGFLKIGALTRMADIAGNSTVKSKYTALAEAARMVGSPQIREMGTIGGNICQLPRCWYFRLANNRFYCLRKGGQDCPAVIGDSRYHSIFGGLWVGTPPCQSACPGHADIPSYLNLIREGNYQGAAEILLTYNPIPAITGRVCRHFCEQGCNRGEFDEPVSVRDVERFMGDYILEHAAEFIKPPETETGKKVAIVGSGPAGLAASYYLRRSGHRVTVFESMEEPGGMLAYVIPEYRLPKDVVRKAVKAIENMGVEFKLNVDIGKDITLDQLKKDYNAVFLATGAWKPVSIRLEGEELARFGLDFLTDIHRGIKKAPGKKILVIGGGSAAFDVATSALRLGVKDVTVACLESRNEMPALPWEIEQAIEEGIKIMPSWGPSKVLQSNGKVTGMELVRCTSVFNGQGKFAPTFDNAVKQTVEADCIMMAVGYSTDLHFIDPASSLKVEGGLIKVNPLTQATDVTRIYAGGAISHGPATVIEAIAAGKRAAIAIDRRLNRGKIPVENQDEKAEKLLKFNSGYLGKTRRLQAPVLPVSERSIDREDNLSLSLKAIENEANRCINCGCVAVNSSDLAPALMTLNAKIKTTQRVIDIEKFFAVQGSQTTVLDPGEIVTEIQIPVPAHGTKSAFTKYALRKSIDFPIVSCAVAINGKNTRICLNAVSGKPYRAIEAEKIIAGKSIDEGTAEAAGEAAVADARAMESNRYKVQIAKVIVKRAILACK